MALGIGIIGTGWVAGEHIRAFQSHPATEIKALCSVDVPEAEQKKAQFGLDCEIYSDFRRLLERKDIDIVTIATPPNFHKEHAVGAAQAGKHIMLEKPMATNFEDARAIRDAVDKAKVKSVVSFVLRWNPLIEIIKQQLHDNAIGRVFFGEVDYFHGVGPWYKQYAWNVKKDMGVSSLLSAGCHAVDCLRWFMGGEIVEVTQYSTFGKGEDFKEYEYDPTTCMICRFADGRIGKVASCIECLQPYVFNINLVGTTGTIKNNMVYSKSKYPGQTSWVTIPTVLPDSGDVAHHPFTFEVANLVESIENNTESRVNVAEAFKTHEVIYAADLSAKENRPVKLPL